MKKSTDSDNMRVKLDRISRQVQIRVTNGASDNYTVSLLDDNGTLVTHEQLDKINLTSIDISTLAPGKYSVVLFEDNLPVKKQKLNLH